MAFEVYEIDRSKPGIVSIDRNGGAHFSIADLKAVGITSTATLLIDRELKRIAIRPPRSGEKGKVVRTGDSGRQAARVCLGGAMQVLGIEKGNRQRKAPVTRKNDMLIVELT